jgi:hypothetical protein
VFFFGRIKNQLRSIKTPLGDTWRIIMKSLRKIIWLIFFLGGVSFTFGDIRLVAVSDTPRPENAKIEIVFPEKNEIKNMLPIRVSVRVTNYSLGQDSDFPRSSEVYDWSIGQSMRIIVDNKPFFAKITQQIDPFNDEGIYFQKEYEFYLPGDLSEGMHIIRAYLVRSYGESLKGEKTFDATTFYYKKLEPAINMDLKRPYLSVNEPTMNYTYEDSKPILLDFYIQNCELSKDGYKVKLVIDKDIVRYLDRWSPYYIYGLRKGDHVVELQLLDAKGKVITGIFNDTKTKFKIR